MLTDMLYTKAVGKQMFIYQTKEMQLVDTKTSSHGQENSLSLWTIISFLPD